MSDGQERLRKLRWQSRRGMKELDVLFEAFLSRQSQQLLAGAWPQFESMLSREDDMLFDWVSGRNLPAEDPAMLELIRTLTHDR